MTPSKLQDTVLLLSSGKYHHDSCAGQLEETIYHSLHYWRPTKRVIRGRGRGTEEFLKVASGQHPATTDNAPGL